MREITIKVYKFEELPEDVQERIIEDRKEYSSIDSIDFNEVHAQFILDHWKEKLETLGFENAEIQYSGFYSQGDGASFTADVNLEKVLNALVMCDSTTAHWNHDRLNFERLYTFASEGLIEYTLERSNHSRYVHENTIRTRVINHTYSNHETHANMFSELEFQIDQMRIDLCCAIHSDLEREWDYIHSDEYIKEEIEAGDCEYDITGQQMN